VDTRIVAFQGERGAYSEEAVVKFFGEVTVMPCPSLPEVFDSVESGAAHAGLIPIENSYAGSINESYDLLLGHGLTIFGEEMLLVKHSLMAPAGTGLHEINRVYSHPQALAQCARFIRELEAQPVAAHDTAGSARMLSETREKRAAAIASRRAARIYGLEVLKEDIQDNPGNSTRFYAIGRGREEKGERNKTVLVVMTQHVPGALFWCLGAFAYRGINIMKLESRPSRDKPWEYVFYLDVEGHTSDVPVRQAMEELRTKTTMLRVLGSFPSGSP
jgi:prephenate dehydratase